MKLSAHQVDLTDIYRTCHPTATENMFFSLAHGTYIKLLNMSTNLKGETKAYLVYFLITMDKTSRSMTSNFRNGTTLFWLNNLWRNGKENLTNSQNKKKSKQNIRNLMGYGKRSTVMLNLNCQLDWIQRCLRLRGLWVCQWGVCKNDWHSKLKWRSSLRVGCTIQ